MIPCDPTKGGCGGSGTKGAYVDLAETELATFPCERCEDMPTLKYGGDGLDPFPEGKLRFVDMQSAIDVAENGKFKPDRDTVERRCTTHETGVSDGFDFCHIYAILQYEKVEAKDPCVVVWTAKPVALTEWSET